MKTFDIVIRGGQVVTDEGVQSADIGIVGEKIELIETEIFGPARTTIDATGLHIFPGVIDAHVHFNEPGRTEWEGIQTGSRSVAAGGGTLFFDMPLNAHPPTLDAESFELKRRAAEASSLVDFALWGGLTPSNLDCLEELADCGVVGFKAFMCTSGIDDFSSVDERSLGEGMKRAASLELPVAVHAESEGVTAQLRLEAKAGHHKTARAYLDSRPISAELEAIGRAIELAGETGCQLHVVHVSCAAGVRLISEARRSGLNVTCETCPHYLTLTDEDVERLGAVAKCAPPLRSATERELLWNELLAGKIQTVGSDHSPSPPEMKQSPDFFDVWGGISGAQHLLPLMLSRGNLPLMSQLLSTNVAQTFRVPPGKGRIAAGCDADLALVKLGGNFELKSEDLFYRHRQSPYIGRHVSARVEQTLLRGRTIFKNGAIVGQPGGRIVRPVG
ncbi:MAG TPA: allantoinase AllB [Verrucomicrobiae bacterium]|jgi:allantoinase|nr:allantoinase AllB [Verrucomicrobiae bacterium]